MIPSSICQYLERIGWKITLTEIRKKEVLHILGVQGGIWGIHKSWIRSWKLDKVDIGKMETWDGKIMLIEKAYVRQWKQRYKSHVQKIETVGNASK